MVILIWSDFNYDFHVTLDLKVAPAEYNYRSKAEMAAAKGHSVLMEGEEHGLSLSPSNSSIDSGPALTLAEAEG